MIRKVVSCITTDTTLPIIASYFTEMFSRWTMEPIYQWLTRTATREVNWFHGYNFDTSHKAIKIQTMENYSFLYKSNFKTEKLSIKTDV